jgi:hypothetical protein
MHTLRKFREILNELIPHSDDTFGTKILCGEFQNYL